MQKLMRNVTRHEKMSLADCPRKIYGIPEKRELVKNTRTEIKSRYRETKNFCLFGRRNKTPDGSVRKCALVDLTVLFQENFEAAAVKESD